jgi:hypothetical protein
MNADLKKEYWNKQALETKNEIRKLLEGGDVLV